MTKKYDDYAVDQRVLKLNVKRGNITTKDYEGFLKSLPDLTNQLEEIPAYEEPKDEELEDLTFSVV